MNYIKQLNTFFELKLTNPLSSNAQCLYINLLNINNKCNWNKEFTVANSTLMGFTELSRQALNRARNELVQKGYIIYKNGKGNNAGKYLIVSFDTQIDTQTDTQIDTQSGQMVTTLNKLNKTKQNNNSSTTKEKNLFELIEKNFGRTLTPIEYEEINKWNDTELTRYAIKQAVTTNKCSIKYISRILSAYERENVKTVQQAQERERQYIEAKSKRKYKTNYEEPKPFWFNEEIKSKKATPKEVQEMQALLEEFK